MTRKSALQLIAIFFVLGLLAELAYYAQIHFPYQSVLSQYGIPLATLTALILMLAYGSFYDRKWSKIVFFIYLALTSLGAWMKILHLASADLLILISSIFLLIGYTIHFMLKKNRIASDYLKLLWAIAKFGSTPFFLMHRIPREYMLVPDILFGVLLAAFIAEQYGKDHLQEKED